MIKTFIVLFNLAFKCRLVSETSRSCRLERKQSNGPARLIAQATRNFTENRASESFFFSQDSKKTCSLIFVPVIKKVHQENIPFHIHVEVD